MNKTYIPAGLTVKQGELHTDTIVVNGTLIVSGEICCKQIIGNGYIQAKSIVCDKIKMRTVSVTEYIVANDVLVNRLMADACSISGQLVAKDYLQARYVHAYKVVTVLSAIESCNVQEFVAVPYKKRSMVLFLFSASLRSFWLSVLTPSGKENKKPHAEPIAKAQTKSEVPMETQAPLNTLDDISKSLSQNTEMLQALLNHTASKPKRKLAVMSNNTDAENSNAA